MKKVNKKITVISFIMLILLISSFILLRIDNDITKILGLIIGVISIIVGFILIKIDKNYDKKS